MAGVSIVLCSLLFYSLRFHCVVNRDLFVKADGNSARDVRCRVVKLSLSFEMALA
jgi:hypothetical protein